MTTPNPKIEAQAREMLAADELERHYAARLKAYLAWKRTPEARGPNRTQMAFAAGWEAHKALSLPSVEIRREALEELDGIEFLEREELLADLENEMHDCMASGHRRAADAMHRAIRALSPSKEEGRL